MKDHNINFFAIQLDNLFITFYSIFINVFTNSLSSKQTNSLKHLPDDYPGFFSYVYTTALLY